MEMLEFFRVLIEIGELIRNLMGFFWILLGFFWDFVENLGILSGSDANFGILSGFFEFSFEILFGFVANFGI